MWIVPSACGPARLKPLMEACAATHMSEEAVCLFDIRERAAGLRLPANWTLVPTVGRIAVAETVRIAAGAFPDAATYGILPTDHRPRSRGWDLALARAAGEWNIAYCNDVVSPGRHPVGAADHVTGAVCLGGALAREMGAIVPPGMTLEDARVAWLTLGRSLGLLRYLGSVIVERRRGREAPDPVPFPVAASDRRARLFRWLNDEARPLALRLRQAMARAARVGADEDRAV